MKILIIINTDGDNVNIENLAYNYYIKLTYDELRIKAKIKNSKNLVSIFDDMMVDFTNTKLFNAFHNWLDNVDLKYVFKVIKRDGCYYRDLGNYNIKIIRRKK